MAKGNNIHDEVKEQRKKLKELTFSGKIEYIWSYYKIPIIGILLAILFAGSLTYSIIRNNYDTVCFIAVLDGRITGYDDDTDALTTGLTDYLGIDGKKEQVDISYTFSLVEKEMDQEAAVTANRIYTYASTNTLDGYLSEKEYIDYFCTDRNIFFWDLRDLFSTEELNELSNYIIYYTNSSGESFLYIFIPSVSPAYNVKPSFNASRMDGIFVFIVHIYNSSKPNLSLAISTIWFITSHATCFPCQLFFTRYPSS